jgi:hypothetical protein
MWLGPKQLRWILSNKTTPQTRFTVPIKMRVPSWAGWMQDKHQAIQEGWRQSVAGAEIYVPAQAGTIVGWRFATWDITRPVQIIRYIEVESF